MVLAIANQVRAALGLECISQQRPIVGIVVAQKRFVQAAAALTFDNIHLFAVARDLAQRIAGGVVHGCGCGHGAGVESLDLVSAETIFLEPHRQMHHVFIAGARMRGDEIRNLELLFTRLGTELVKHAFEPVISANPWLHHLIERT